MSCFSGVLSGERVTAFLAVLMSLRAQLWAMRAASFRRLFSQGETRGQCSF